MRIIYNSKISHKHEKILDDINFKINHIALQGDKFIKKFCVLKLTPSENTIMFLLC